MSALLASMVPLSLEYGSLTSNKKMVLWEIEAKQGHPAIHGFSLHKGENSTEPRGFGRYSVLTPSRADSFTLTRGSEYKIEVWGRSSFLAKSSAVFQLDDVSN